MRSKHFFVVLAICLFTASGTTQFREQFLKAAETGDRKGIAAACSGDNGYTQAVYYGRDLITTLVADRSDATATEHLDYLVEAITKVHKSAVLEKMKSFYFGKGESALGSAEGLEQKYQAMMPKLMQALRQKDMQVAAEILPEIKKLAQQTEQFGDLWLAFRYYTQTLNLCQMQLSGQPNPEFLEVMGAALRCHSGWQLRQDDYAEYLKQMLAQFKRDPGGSDRTRSPKGVELHYAPGSKWLRLTGASKPWRNPFRGVSQITAAHPILWFGTTIRGVLGKGMSERAGMGKIHGFKPEIQLVRIKGSTYGIDTNMDGKPEKKFKLKNKPSLIKFKQDIDGTKVEKAIFFWIGGANEKIGNMALDFAPEVDWSMVRFRGATTIEVELEGKKILFIDEDSNGSFGDEPAFYSPSRCKPYGQMICDSMLLPGGKNPVPFSDFIRINESYYKFKFSGTTAKARKLDMNKTPLGRLRLLCKGPKSARPRTLIMGECSAFHGANFDLARNSKGVTVPVGTYVILGGLILRGKGEKSKSVSIGTSARPKEFEVREGEETLVTIGAPYKYDFKVELSGQRLRIDGLSIKTVGSCGEVYMDPWGAPPAPKVFYRKGTRGPGIKLGEMKVIKKIDILSQYLRMKQESSEEFNYEDGLLAPMDFSAKKPRGTIQIKLKSSKNPYFGKVESDWK